MGGNLCACSIEDPVWISQLILLWRDLEIGWKSKVPQFKLGWTAKKIDTVANFPRLTDLANHTLAHKLVLRGTVQGFQTAKRCLIASVTHIYIPSDFSYNLLLRRHVTNLPSESTIWYFSSVCFNSCNSEHIWNSLELFDNFLFLPSKKYALCFSHNAGFPSNLGESRSTCQRA